MFCEQCGNVMSDNAKFCGKCGHRVGETKLICPECGAEYSEGQIYCEECGIKIANGGNEHITSNTAANTNVADTPATPAYVASFRISGDKSKDVALLSSLAKGELSYAQIVKIVNNLYSGCAPMDGLDNAAPSQYNINSFSLSGNKIQDIKRLQTESGMDMAAAKNIIDKLYAGKSLASTPEVTTITNNPNKCANVDPNQLIYQSSSVTWYKGDKALSSLGVNGILKLYSNRIEFLTTFKAFTFSTPPSSMYFSDIADVSKGRYMMGSSILVTMKNGQKHTFAALGSKLYDFLDQLIEYKG